MKWGDTIAAMGLSALVTEGGLLRQGAITDKWRRTVKQRIFTDVVMCVAGVVLYAFDV